MSTNRILLGVVLLDLIGFGIVMPILPSYAARYTVSDTAIGVLVSSFPAMQFLLAPAWGKLSDRIGRRPVLLLGLLGSTTSYVMFATAESFGVLLLSRILGGALGATVTIAQAYLADLTAPERRARSMGLIGAAFGIGFIFGPAIGGLSSAWSESAPGLIAAGFSFTGFLLAWVRLPETRHQIPATPALAESLHSAMRWQPVLRPFAVVFWATLGFTVMYAVFPLYCERVLGYDRRQISYLFVYLGLTSAVVQGWLVGKLVPKVRESTLMTVGALLMAAGFGGLAFDGFVPAEGRYPALLTTIVLLSAGVALVAPSVSGLVSRMTPADEQGKVLGSLQSVGLLARIGGPTIFGIINEAGGVRHAFLAAAVIALAAAGVSRKVHLRGNARIAVDGARSSSG